MWGDLEKEQKRLEELANQQESEKARLELRDDLNKQETLGEKLNKEASQAWNDSFQLKNGLPEDVKYYSKLMTEYKKLEKELKNVEKRGASEIAANKVKKSLTAHLKEKLEEIKLAIELNGDSKYTKCANIILGLYNDENEDYQKLNKQKVEIDIYTKKISKYEREKESMYGKLKQFFLSHVNYDKKIEVAKGKINEARGIADSAINHARKEIQDEHNESSKETKKNDEEINRIEAKNNQEISSIEAKISSKNSEIAKFKGTIESKYGNDIVFDRNHGVGVRFLNRETQEAYAISGRQVNKATSCRLENLENKASNFQGKVEAAGEAVTSARKSKKSANTRNPPEPSEQGLGYK